MAAIDKFEADLIASGWQVVPGGPVWYARSFRRVWDEETDADPFFSEESIGSAAAMRATGVSPSTYSGMSFSD